MLYSSCMRDIVLSIGSILMGLQGPVFVYIICSNEKLCSLVYRAITETDPKDSMPGLVFPAVLGCYIIYCFVQAYILVRLVWV